MCTSHTLVKLSKVYRDSPTSIRSSKEKGPFEHKYLTYNKRGGIEPTHAKLISFYQPTTWGCTTIS